MVMESRSSLRSGIGPRQSFPRDRTVLELFRRQVLLRPDAPAVRYRERVLTYRALDRAADAVASCLAAAGVGRGSVVPLLATEGLEFPVGLFGVVKTGAAFVPVDPAWPARRLRAVATDLAPVAVVATPAVSGAVAAVGPRSRAVLLDAGGAAECLVEMGEPDSGPPAGSRPPLVGAPLATDLIYGYYTSGSTGTPKCTLNRHRSLVNRLTAMSRRFGDGSRHTTLQNSRATFDSAMWQVLWPLTTGGQVVLPDRSGLLDLPATAATIGRHRVTITDFVPSILAAFVSLLEVRPDLREMVALERVLIGGEAANPVVVRRLRKLLPRVRVTNTYGPTECAIGSVFHEVDGDHDEVVPLGRPIANTTALVLDDQLRPVRPGEVGEIYLGGECVGLGYLNDPERTAHAFLPNPYPVAGGSRLYRTGDLAYLDGHGTIYFAGRQDDQVKVDGVRVELGDVDAVLRSHPLVGDAATVVLDGRELVAGISARDPARPPSGVELRRYAAERLPAELAPARVVSLDGAIPVNHNGKADRAALATLLRAAREAVTTGGVPPADRTEEVVAAAWCQVLGREEVSTVVPFVDYGGTSLVAFQLAVTLSTMLDRTVRPQEVLAAATVREQAARIRRPVPEAGSQLSRLRRDARWRPPPVAGAPAPEAEAVLLTGATGFVGAHILAELLAGSDRTVTCLVRARDTTTALERLRGALRYYQLTGAAERLARAVRTGRVEVLPGRLGPARFGLPRTGYEKLAATTGTVLHAAGLVSFLADYQAHRAANVAGVREMLRLAAAAGGAPVHALSTIGILAGGGRDRAWREEELPPAAGVPGDGYSQSKYVAEKLLANGRRGGVGGVVYRLGEVWPHRRLGVANPASLVHSLLYACVRAGGGFPTEAAVRGVPVDVAAKLVAGAAAGGRQIPDGTLHVLWPGAVKLADAFAHLGWSRPLEPLGYPEFRRRVESLARRPYPDERLVRLSLLLPPPGPDAAAPETFEQMFAVAGVEVETARFARYAEADGGSPDPAEPVGAALAGYLRKLAANPVGEVD